MLDSPALQEYYAKQLASKKRELGRTEALWNRRASEVSRFTVDENDTSLGIIRQKTNLAGKSVLDIGFGAGRYLLEFLRLGANVSGVEISAGMIGQAQLKLQASGLPYDAERLVHSSWEALDLQQHGWHRAFDLVFLHMTPAISSLAMLQKVLSASRRHVYLASYVYREDSLLQDLLVGFGLQQEPARIRMADDFHAIYNLLYSWGYLPQIEFRQRSKERCYRVDEVLERYAAWLWRDTEITALRRKALQQTLEHRAIDGKISTRGTDVIGHLLVDTSQRLLPAVG